MAPARIRSPGTQRLPRPLLGRLHWWFVRHRLPQDFREGQLRKDYRLIVQYGAFNRSWYLKKNPDVRRARIDPLVHYLRTGAADGLDPSSRFNTNRYLSENPAARALGVNALAHFLRSVESQNQQDSL